MDGIINILKPPGMTSFDVVAQIRRLLKVKKVGHTGTLDPDAVGVLPICLGKATRMVEMLMEDHKFYRGEITLGVETDTEDATGRVLAQRAVGEMERERIEEVIRRFRGTIQQIPPMVSALKHDGKRLYELAREGVEVEREAREVEIYALTLLRATESKFWVDVECSKGTYIRTLAKDIGQALGTGAHLSYLIRTGTGGFHIAESVTLEEIREAVEQNRVQDVILPVDWGIRTLPQVLVHGRALKKAMNGARLQKGDYESYPQGLQPGDRVRLYVPDGFIAISEVVDPEREVLQPIKVFA